MNGRRFLWALLPCAVILTAAAWLRSAEYDEQYTLFLMSGVPRPDWPATVFPAGLAREIQAGHTGLAGIARDLRVTDVHPPLYFWLMSLWRDVFGHGLFEARLLSVALGIGALALTGVIAHSARLPPVWAMLLTLGCYGFTYTSVVARGFALAQLLVLSGVACLMLQPRIWRFALAGALFGAATFSNYLSVFAAGACLLAVGLDTFFPRRGQSGHATNPVIGVPNDPRHEASGAARARHICVHLCVSVVPLFFGRVNPIAVLARSAIRKVEPQIHTDADAARPTAGAASVGQAIAALFGFLIFIPADLWWFLAQRGSRMGQFPPFSLSQSMTRLAVRFSGSILGGLPLYVPGMASTAVAGALGILLAWLLILIVLRWHQSGTPSSRRMFALAALAPGVGLLILGAIFNNTPIEVRYLAFSTPFVGLLLAGALGARWVAIVLAVQAISIAGLMLAPQTMQPAGAAAHAAAELVEDGVVLLPRGNDGVGVVGAFAIESPPALPLLLIPADATPEQIRARIRPWHRVVLALLEQDTASRAASEAMRTALTDPGWREVARGPNVAVYERTDGGT
jgi:hypothetical protein